MNDSDIKKLQRINQLCLDITNAVANVGFDDFISNLMLNRGFILTLEQIGENAKYLSNDFRIKHDKIIWKQIVGLRNIIAHEYDELDLILIWQTITVGIPELFAFTEEVLS
jgi:uncharacterized protein with HEPN domain